MGKSTFRLGLIGLGKIARDQHLPAIAANPRFALVATASPDGRLAGVAGHDSLGAMLEAGHALDAVCLCTPPAVRAALAQQALAAGLAVMLEKPPAATLAQAQALADTARAAGAPLLASWHSRETPAVDAARQWLAGRRVEAVTVRWLENIRQWHPGQDWLLAEGGFGVFDPAINALSILTHILPAPLTLAEAALGVPENRAMPATATLMLDHAGAAVRCTLSILHEGPPCWEIAIATDAGTLHLGAGGHALSLDGVPQSFAETGEYPRLYGRFADLIAARASEADLAPLALVEAALTAATRRALPPFHF